MKPDITVTDKNGAVAGGFQSSFALKVAGSVLTVVLIAIGTAVWQSVSSSGDNAKSLARIEPAVDANTEFRLKGDRVTPSDLEKAVEQVSKRYEAAMDRQSRLTEQFVTAINGVNQTLNAQTALLGKLEARTESIQREQTVAREERNAIRDKAPN